MLTHAPFDYEKIFKFANTNYGLAWPNLKSSYVAQRQNT